MNGWYRYCPHDRAAEAEALGWENIGPLPGNHGFYAVLLFWPHECDPVWFGDRA